MYYHISLTNEIKFQEFSIIFKKSSLVLLYKTSANELNHLINRIKGSHCHSESRKTSGGNGGGVVGKPHMKTPAMLIVSLRVDLPLKDLNASQHYEFQQRITK